MSTRGAVGVFQGRQWRGVYNHSDSYPLGLGKEIWNYLHDKGVDIRQFCKEILNYGDWREYRKGGLCEYCGKVGVGQPCDISGAIYVALSDGKLFPDPEAINHSHDQSKAPIHSKNAREDALFIEWAYVVHPENETFTIFKGVLSKGNHIESPDWKEIEQRGNTLSTIAYEEIEREVA